MSNIPFTYHHPQDVPHWLTPQFRIRCTTMQQKLFTVALAFLLLLGTASLAPAQQDHRVSGVVVDAGDGSPLAGVTVKAKGAGGQSQTNATGRFSIIVSTGAQLHLVFAKNGYRSVTKAIDDSTSAVIVSMKRTN